MLIDNVKYTLGSSNWPDFVSAIQCFLLGTNLAGRTCSRKCWSHYSPQSFEEKICWILNSCSSTPACKVITITKLLTAKMDENITVPTIPYYFRDISSGVSEPREITLILIKRTLWIFFLSYIHFEKKTFGWLTFQCLSHQVGWICCSLGRCFVFCNVSPLYCAHFRNSRASFSISSSRLRQQNEKSCISTALTSWLYSWPQFQKGELFSVHARKNSEKLSVSIIVGQFGTKS